MKSIIIEGETDFDFKPRPRWPLDPDANIKEPILKILEKKE